MSKQVVPAAPRSRTETQFEAWHAMLPTDTRKLSLFGLLALLFAFGGGGLWAATAPLAGAALATGVVIATGQNKVVQHLEGGIIEEILVQEGEKVDKGQILIRLSRSSAAANLQRYRGQYDLLRALRARYRAELNGDVEISFPEDLIKKIANPEIAEIIETQKSEFGALRDELESEIAVFEARQAAVEEEIAGLEAQRISQSQQLALIEEELEATKTLLDQGLAQKSKYLALQRKLAELSGNQGQVAARIARAKQTIAETDQEIIKLRKERRRTSITELRDVQGRLADVEQQMNAAEEIVRRIEVRAPVDGVVIKMHHNTQGGVVAPGEAILELLPADASLLVEARVRPEDIDAVHAGRPAKLRFTSLRRRTTPTLPGEVTYVSADRLTDAATNASYYTARIRIDSDLPAELAAVEITPGMPVEVYVETRSRTALQYFIGPITDTFARAFLEE